MEGCNLLTMQSNYVVFGLDIILRACTSQDVDKEAGRKKRWRTTARTLQVFSSAFFVKAEVRGSQVSCKVFCEDQTGSILVFVKLSRVEKATRIVEKSATKICRSASQRRAFQFSRSSAQCLHLRMR